MKKYILSAMLIAVAANATPLSVSMPAAHELCSPEYKNIVEQMRGAIKEAEDRNTEWLGNVVIQAVGLGCLFLGIGLSAIDAAQRERHSKVNNGCALTGAALLCWYLRRTYQKALSGRTSAEIKADFDASWVKLNNTKLNNVDIVHSRRLPFKATVAREEWGVEMFRKYFGVSRQDAGFKQNADKQ